MRTALYIFFSLAYAVTAFAQDPHHSQYFNMPTYYNPAATGQGVEHIRATAVYRHQWPSLSSPFITQGLLFDKQVSRVGLGALLNSNSSGDAGIKRLQFGGMVSYRHKVKAHQFAAGIYTGLIQKSFDPSEMTFDDQYIDDAGYSAANPTSEYFAFTKVIRPDFGAGLLWTMGEEEKNKVQPFAGVSLLHINQPKEVFIEESNTTALKQTFNAGAKITINDFVDIKPSGIYAMQMESVELMYGCLATLKFEDRNAAEAGIYMRQEESAIAYLGYRWNSLMAGLSYDLTTSNSISGPGAFELTLTYIPKAKPKKEKKPVAKTTTPVKKPVQQKMAETKQPVNQVQEKKPEHQPLTTPAVQQKPTVMQKPLTEAKPATPPAVKPVPAPALKKMEPAEKLKTRTIVNQVPANKMQKPVQPIKDKIPVTATQLTQQQKATIETANSEIKPAPSPEVKKIERIEKLKTRAVVKQVPATSKQKAVQPQKDKITVTATQLTLQQKGSVDIENAEKPVNVQEQIPSGKIAAVESQMKKAAEAKKETVSPPVKIVTKAEPKPNMQPVAGDADKDGVPDKIDRCPDRPGLASDHGCPSATAAIDIDGDGVLNNEDECPYIKGNAENNGCPAEYSNSESFIKFEVNSVKINGFDVIDILEPVSDSLYVDSKATIVIAGHTDDEGNEYYNMILSQNRAEAVKAYFVKHGVAADKIHTIGYGETKPRESNETEYGRRLNRRAEIYIIK